MKHNNKPIIFYDEVCALCNFSLKFLINNDVSNMLLFSPLQGKVAKQMLSEDYQKNLNKKKRPPEEDRLISYI